MAGVGGVGHVGLRTISREIACRETSAGRGTDRKHESLPARRPGIGDTYKLQVFLLDGQIQGVHVSAVVDCGSPICILSNEVFKCIGLTDTLGKDGSKVVGAEGSQLDILRTMELDTAFKGIKTKQLFYTCDNLKQSALLGVDFLRDNGCVVDFNKEILHAGNTEVKLRDDSS